MLKKGLDLEITQFLTGIWFSQSESVLTSNLDSSWELDIKYSYHSQRIQLCLQTRFSKFQ